MPIPKFNGGFQSSTQSSLLETRLAEYQENGSRVKLQLAPVDSVENQSTHLVLPTDIYDGLNESEKQALPKLFAMFFASRAFRSTMTYDLTYKPGPSVVSGAALNPEIYNLFPSSTSISFNFGRWRSLLRSPILRSRTRFPLMELPTELRIMIATYVLHVPGGLQWIWSNYLKGPKVATLMHHAHYHSVRLEDANALARTCKQLREEIQGLIFSLNVIRFNLHSMHINRVPQRCHRVSSGLSSNLEAIGEALNFLVRFVPRETQSKLKRIEFRLSVEDLQTNWRRIDRLNSSMQHLQLVLRISDWSLQLLEFYRLKKIKQLEEEGEPVVSEHEQMVQRIDDFMTKGQQLQQYVREVWPQTRKWRAYPQPIFDDETPKIRAYMSDEKWNMIRDWERNGI